MFDSSYSQRRSHYFDIVCLPEFLVRPPKLPTFLYRTYHRPQIFIPRPSSCYCSLYDAVFYSGCRWMKCWIFRILLVPYPSRVLRAEINKLLKSKKPLEKHDIVMLLIQLKNIYFLISGYASPSSNNSHLTTQYNRKDQQVVHYSCCPLPMVLSVRYTDFHRHLQHV